MGILMIELMDLVGEIENKKIFILANPAGKDIYCLTAGINLPENVEIAPCLSKKLSIFIIVSSLIKTYFPYFKRMTLPNFIAK